MLALGPVCLAAAYYEVVGDVLGPLFWPVHLAGSLVLASLLGGF